MSKSILKKYIKRFKKDYIKDNKCTIISFYNDNGILISQGKSFAYEISITNFYATVYGMRINEEKEIICSDNLTKKYFDDLKFWLSKNA